MDSFSEDIAQWKSVVADAETELKQLEGQVTEASARKSGAGQLDDNRVRARRIAEWEDVKARQMESVFWARVKGQADNSHQVGYRETLVNLIQVRREEEAEAMEATKTMANEYRKLSNTFEELKRATGPMLDSESSAQKDVLAKIGSAKQVACEEIESLSTRLRLAEDNMRKSHASFIELRQRLASTYAEVMSKREDVSELQRSKARLKKQKDSSTAKSCTPVETWRVSDDERIIEQLAAEHMRVEKSLKEAFDSELGLLRELTDWSCQRAQELVETCKPAHHQIVETVGQIIMEIVFQAADIAASEHGRLFYLRSATKHRNL